MGNSQRRLDNPNIQPECPKCHRKCDKNLAVNHPHYWNKYCSQCKCVIDACSHLKRPGCAMCVQHQYDCDRETEKLREKLYSTCNPYGFDYQYGQVQGPLRVHM
jgi:hypothetical protein